MSPETSAGRPGDVAAASPFLAVAVEAVLKAGATQLAHLERGVTVTEKGRADIVTDVDVEVETMFRVMIADRFPDHGVLGEELEESRPHGAGPSHRWLFDPVDGTTNYARGLPFFCASLALEVDGVVEVAAVFDPSRRELFTAERGRGAQLNSRALHVSQTDRLGDALLGTGFPHGASAPADALSDVITRFALGSRGVRRLGSAALDLCYVAAGRLDGFWDRNLKAWDTAAGALIVREAGGTTTALDGQPFTPASGQVLASNGRIHGAMLDVIRSTESAE